MSEFFEARGLEKSFRCGEDHLDVLKGASLSLQPGDLASVIGDSGSGKSTLLHILGGMEAPDGGSVHLEGQDVYKLSREERALFRNRNVGFVFQFHHLLPEFDALENLMMPLLLRRMSLREATAQARQLLVRMGLEARAHNRPGELSGGEQQRIAIGRALITHPSLLLMDEPTGNLDPDTGHRIMDLVFGLAEESRVATVLVTHNPELARRCPRQFRMTGGHLLDLSQV